MTQKFWGAVAIVCLLSVTTSGADKKENKLPEPVVKALEKAESIEVYSLDGERGVEDGWHGTRVLGKTTVNKAKDTKAIAVAVTKGVAEGTDGARCFIPRHGIRVTYDDKTYDLVICFECHWVYIYTDKSDKPTVLIISEAPQKLLNTILTDAKVQLAKPTK